MTFGADTIIALATLTAMEVILGIDNIVFIAILVGRLPRDQQAATRRFGLIAALVTRVALLFSITWVMGLTKPLFHAFNHAVSGRDLILIAGGLFLLTKSTREIHHKVEGGGEEEHQGPAKAASGVLAAAIQIGLLDIVFSLDSVITAVGMTDNIPIMVTAVVLAMIVMLVFSGSVSDFVMRHPTVKVLALSFLLLIGVMLIAEGTGLHIGKGYIYFAMAFSLAVEMLNLRMKGAPRRKKARAR